MYFFLILMQPKDRVYHICNELMTTEDAYVERLGLLVKVRSRHVNWVDLSLHNKAYLVYLLSRACNLCNSSNQISTFDIHHSTLQQGCHGNT